jgi:hypothetical protein
MAHGVQWSWSRAAVSCFALLPPLDTQHQSADRADSSHERTVITAREMKSSHFLPEQIAGRDFEPSHVRQYEQRMIITVNETEITTRVLRQHQQRYGHVGPETASTALRSCSHWVRGEAGILRVHNIFPFGSTAQFRPRPPP